MRCCPLHFSLCCLALAMSSLAAESLFTAETLADGTLYSDQIARTVGDLITVRVLENMTIEDSQDTELSRENDLSFGVNMIPGSNRLQAAVGSGAAGRLPGLDLTSDKEFEGEASYSASGRMLFTLSGRVIDVLDNGNLVI